jgi:serine/threonine-protein kinase
MATSVPKQILHYVPAEKIGSGITGDVYKAWDSVLERFVALKLLNPELMEHTAYRAQVLGTLRALADTSHPHICSLYGVHKADDRYVVAMELIEGHTLRELLREGPWTGDRFLDLAVKAAGALNHAHSRCILHGNVTPANIAYCDGGDLRVLDFGFSTLPIERDNPDYTVSAETVRYRSPEQITGEEVTPLSDLFSLGAVLYEVLTGSPAFSGTDRRWIEDAILEQEPSYTSLLPDARTSGAIVLVLEKLLAKKPDERFTHAGELQITLTEVISFGKRKPVREFFDVKPTTSRQYLMLSFLAALLIIFWLVITTVPR